LTASVTVSVVICAYTEERWSHLLAAISSVRTDQHIAPHQVIVVIDHNPALAARLRPHAGNDVQVVENRFGRGLSGARNTGIATATGDVVAFLDDDARAEPPWVGAHAAQFARPDVVGVGGVVLPDWAAARPRWFPPEFGWVVGCTYIGAERREREIRNPIGANMSFRRAALVAAGGFDTGLGRVGATPLGCEETELSIRIVADAPASRIMHAPGAVVRHHVTSQRGRIGYFVRRCWCEGLSKARVAAHVGAASALSAERSYAARTLPAGIATALGRGARHRDPWPLVSAAAMVLGLVLAAGGYATGRTLRHRPASSSSRKVPPMPDHHDWLDFEVHGRLGIRVDSAAPTARQLATMLDCFRVAGPVAPDIIVSGVMEEQDAPSHLEDEVAYTAQSVRLPRQGVQVTRADGRYRISGRGELLTTLVPVLDRAMVERGAAMIHAATVAHDGVGIALPAAGGTGKTSTVAKLAAQQGYAFMGDDWAFLGEDGTMLGYAKPMFIKPHHRTIYPHLFSGARKPLVPSRLSRPLGHLTTVVHPVVIRYPRLADLSRRWSPEHRMVDAATALPGTPVAQQVPLGLVVYVERYAGESALLTETDEQWMVDRMVGNFHVEMPGFSQQLVTAMAATNFLPWSRLVEEKSAVLAQSIKGLPCRLLQVPAIWTADRASDEVVRILSTLLPLLDERRESRA
jgi:GT2 family glycosyltransferase